MKATGVTSSLVFVNRYSDEFSSSLSPTLKGLCPDRS